MSNIMNNPNIAIIIKDDDNDYKLQELIFKNLGIEYKLIEPKDVPKDDPYWYVDDGCYYCGRKDKKCHC